MKPVGSWIPSPSAYVWDVRPLAAATPQQRADQAILGLLSDGKIAVVDVAAQALSFSLHGPGSNPDDLLKGLSSGGGTMVFAGYEAANESRRTTVVGWDLRAGPRPISRYENNSAVARGPVSCVSVGLNGALVAAGTDYGSDSAVLFWDARASSDKPLGVYTESHSDGLTSVEFRDSGSSVLATGSLDGLVCVYDVTRPGGETGAMQFVANAESCVSKVGFFGAQLDGIAASTSSETISLFDLSKKRLIRTDGNDVERDTGLRQKLGQLIGGNVDYLVGTIWEPKGQRLLLVAGDHGGNCFVYTVEHNEAGYSYLGPLTGGHTDIVRSATAMDFGPEKGWNVFTGSEDGRIVHWAPA